MAATDGSAHLLSLKVMRLSRPDLAAAWQPFYSSSPSFSAHSSASIVSLQGDTPLSGHPKTLRDLTSASEMLMLPASFGSIQLGETFSSCLCVNNETQLDIQLAQVKVEMQTVTSKVVLYEMEGLVRTVREGDSLEYVVHHEMKELGQHVLACTMSYRLPPNTRAIAGASEDPNDLNLQTLRKFYKFAVTHPLSVKTKVHTAKSPTALLSQTEREKIFLEVHIQNLTQDAIYFERMTLECTDDWETTDGNILTDPDGKTQTSIFSGNMALMQPQDMRQYVYIITPKVISSSLSNNAPGSIIPLGRLDISWRSHLGEPGRLLTSMLSRRIPLPPAQPASAIPPHVKKSVVGPGQTRPYPLPISSQPQSRPGTPVLGQRSSSPSIGRASISSEAPLAEPSEFEVQLLVRHVPRKEIIVEKPFSIAFSVVVSPVSPPRQEHLKRKITLAIQYIRRRQGHAVARVTLPPAESFTPRLPSSGFSTPASVITGSFNYALAHQKILAVSSRPPPIAGPIASESGNPDNSFPSPFFEAGLGEQPNPNAIVSFIGPSLIYLPPLEIDYSNSIGKRPAEGNYIQDFELLFVGLRRGFSTAGGLRILLAEDQDSEVEWKRAKIEILKEYESIAEIWVL